jgi:Uma2 family endonuclease
VAKTRATIEDLYNIPENGKAEIINGEVVRILPAGGKAGRVSGKIFFNLIRYEQTNGGGYAFGDNVGFIVDLPNRGSFSPYAAWYTGELQGMKFLTGAPAFAVEVRSENAYGPAAERQLAEKRRDYFAAGTLVVWDVRLSERRRGQSLPLHRSGNPDDIQAWGHRRSRTRSARLDHARR